MRLVVRTIGLMLLWSYPAGLSAQWASYPDRSPLPNEAVPTAYQQAVTPRENHYGAAPPQQTAYAHAGPSASPSPLLTPRASAADAESSKQPGGLRSALTVVGSLAVVLGVFFLIVWVLRRASPAILGSLPAEAFETLGRAPLAHHQQAHLLRYGNKLLLVSVSAAGATTLSEITDPAEVDRLTNLCRQTRPSSPAAALRQVFRQAEDSHA